VLAAPDGTREILAKWLESRKQISAKDLEPTSWNFAPMKTRGPVVFTDASGKQDVARKAGLDNIRQLKDHGDGTATYGIDLSR
jgi:2',3'-cyclic-nucleotide 2'-phosphodiesterase/3'-nucleotidase